MAAGHEHAPAAPELSSTAPKHQQGLRTAERAAWSAEDGGPCDLGAHHLPLPCWFGPYELLRLIGKGATAQVFEARRMGRFGVALPVALKRLLPRLCKQRRFLEMFVREAAVCSQLQHPNILQIQDFNEIAGHYYIVTDFVDGCDLDSLIQIVKDSGGTFPPSVAAEIMRQLLHGLVHAHGLSDASGASLNLLHRDIKPSNVLVSWNGLVKLADFGLAKARSCSIDTTTSQHVKGTLRYMSPEHVRLEEITQISDLFSVGLVLYEVLTLEPFVNTGSKMSQIIRSIAFEPREARLARVSGEKRVFEPLLEMSLQSETIRRYGSAGEFLDDLHAVIPRLPPGPTLAGFISSLRPSLREARAAVNVRYSEERKALAL